MTSWSDVISNHAMVMIDDERLNEISTQNPALFLRRMSLYMKNAIPLFSRPPQMVSYLLSGLAEPEFSDFLYTPASPVLEEDTDVDTGLTGYDLCVCVAQEQMDDGEIYSTVIENATYDSETGIATIPAGSEGQYYEFDFYKDGSFEKDLSYEQKRILGLCIASVWDERFFRSWLNDQMKIKDQSFSTVNESNYMREGAAKKAKNRSLLNDELRKYEQDCAYKAATPYIGITMAWPFNPSPAPSPTPPAPTDGDYNKLSNKPSIEGVTLEGDKTFEDLGLKDIGELADDLVVSNPLGKYTMDEVIADGTKFESIFRGLLSKTYYPSLSDPSLSINYSSTSLMKVGDPIPSQTATLTFNRGSISPQYTAESPFRAGEATGYSIVLSGASVEYSESGAGNQFSVPSFTRNSPGNVAINASVDYSEGVQPKDSDGNDYSSPLPAGSKGTSKMIEFILPFYHGVSSSRTVSDLSTLTEDLSKKGTKTYSYSTSKEHAVIAYNSSYGDLRSIIDENGFENIDGWDKSSLTVDGQTYFVYVAYYATTDPSASYTFYF